jgi:uncharacterized membrane protein
MNSDLIVITFDDADEALKVFDAMQAMRKEPLLNLEQSIIITRNRTGKIRLHQTRDLTANDNVANGDVLGLLAGLILGNPMGVVWGIEVGEARLELARQGFDDKFGQVIATSMGNNSSAIFFLIRRDSRSDRDEVLNVLGLFKGKVHHTTITPEIDRYLLQIIETRIPPDQESL